MFVTRVCTSLRFTDRDDLTGYTGFWSLRILEHRRECTSDDAQELLSSEIDDCLLGHFSADREMALLVWRAHRVYDCTLFRSLDKSNARTVVVSACRTHGTSLSPIRTPRIKHLSTRSERYTSRILRGNAPNDESLASVPGTKQYRSKLYAASPMRTGSASNGSSPGMSSCSTPNLGAPPAPAAPSASNLAG
jgi:hypothetical protein